MRTRDAACSRGRRNGDEVARALLRRASPDETSRDHAVDAEERRLQLLCELTLGEAVEVEHVVRDGVTRGVELLGDVDLLGAEEGRDLAEDAGLVAVDDAQPREALRVRLVNLT